MAYDQAISPNTVAWLWQALNDNPGSAALRIFDQALVDARTPVTADVEKYARLTDALDGYDLSYANESRRYHGIGLSGPNARELLSRITRDDVSCEALRFRDIRRTFVAGVPAILTRLSFSVRP